GACGLAAGDGPCTAANEGTVCRSGACGTALSVCIPAGGCGADADCSATQFCNGATFMCTPKLGNGKALLKEPIHANGKCSPTVGGAECSSAVCDVADNACGFLNGDGACTPATAMTVCRGGGCGTDDKCGFVNGQGPCTTGSICRSGVCGASSH